MAKRFKDLTRTRDSCPGDLSGRRRRADFRRFRRRTASRLSGDRENFRGNASRGIRASRQPFRALQRTLRQPHSPDPPRRCFRIRAPQADVACPGPLGIKAVRKQAELMEMETRQFYLKALTKGDGRLDSQAARRSGRGGAQASADRRVDGRKTSGRAFARRRRCGRQEAVPAAGDSTGPGRVDGRLGLDAGTGIRGGVRDQK